MTDLRNSQYYLKQPRTRASSLSIPARLAGRYEQVPATAAERFGRSIRRTIAASHGHPRNQGAGHYWLAPPRPAPPLRAKVRTFHARPSRRGDVAQLEARHFALRAWWGRSRSRGRRDSLWRLPSHLSRAAPHTDLPGDVVRDYLGGRSSRLELPWQVTPLLITLKVPQE